MKTIHLQKYALAVTMCNLINVHTIYVPPTIQAPTLMTAGITPKAQHAETGHEENAP